MNEECLDKRTRAEDIILGALGYGEEARIISIRRRPAGYEGRGEFSGGECFEFCSDGEMSELEEWALQILTGERS